MDLLRWGVHVALHLRSGGERRARKRNADVGTYYAQRVGLLTTYCRHGSRRLNEIRIADPMSLLLL